MKHQTALLASVPTLLLCVGCESLMGTASTPEGQEALGGIMVGGEQILSGQTVSGIYNIAKGAAGFMTLWLTGKGGMALKRSVQNSEQGKLFGSPRKAAPPAPAAAEAEAGPGV